MRARTCIEARVPLRGQNVILEGSTENRVGEGAPPVTPRLRPSKGGQRYTQSQLGSRYGCSSLPVLSSSERVELVHIVPSIWCMRPSAL